LASQIPPSSQRQGLTNRLIKNICSRLAERCWSLKTLSDLADLPYETVKKLISGKIQKPSFYCIWQIAQALDCTLDDLASDGSSDDPYLQHLNENSEEITRILTDLEAILKISDTPK